MTTTSYGFTGSLNASQWAAGEGYRGPRVKSLTDLKVTAVGGSRAVTVGTGESFSSGVRAVVSTGETVNLSTPAAGQWFLIVAHRDWTVNTTTFVALAGATTTTAVPTTGPTTAPSGLSTSPGTAEDQPLAWAWVNFSSTTVTLFDVRVVLSDGVPVVPTVTGLYLLRGAQGQLAATSDGTVYSRTADSWVTWASISGLASSAQAAAAQSAANAAQAAATAAQTSANAAQTTANTALGEANTALNEVVEATQFASATGSVVSGWALNRFSLKKINGIVLVDISVTRTGSAITAGGTGNIGNLQVGTVPWHPNVTWAGLAPGPGGPVTSMAIDSSGKVWLCALPPDYSVAVNSEVTAGGAYATTDTTAGSGSSTINAVAGGTSGSTSGGTGGTTGGTGGTTTVTGAPSSTAVVWSSQFPYNIPSATDSSILSYVCDGASDEAQINAAITAVAAQGGGRVQLLGDTFNIAAPITLKTGVWLNGEGLGAIIKATTAMTGMVTLADDTVHLTTLSNFTIEGNGQDCLAGVYYSASGGQVFTSTPASNPDPAHRIENLFIHATGTSSSAGHGLLLRGPNMRGIKVSNLRIQSVTGCGLWDDGAVDNQFVNIEIGSSGSGGPAVSSSSTAPVGYGFYMNGANNMLTNCKSWYSRAAGFYNHSVRTGYTNCQAQDNYSHGFQDVYGKSTFTGCHADSNGQTSTSAGFYLAGVSTSVVGCLSYDRGGQSWQQDYGFQFTSGFSYSRVTGCVTYGNSSAAQTGSVGTGATVDIQADASGK